MSPHRNNWDFGVPTSHVTWSPQVGAVPADQILWDGTADNHTRHGEPELRAPIGLRPCAQGSRACLHRMGKPAPCGRRTHTARPGETGGCGTTRSPRRTGGLGSRDGTTRTSGRSSGPALLSGAAQGGDLSERVPLQREARRAAGAGECGLLRWRRAPRRRRPVRQSCPARSRIISSEYDVPGVVGGSCGDAGGADERPVGVPGAICHG